MSHPPSGQKLNAWGIEFASVLVHPSGFKPAYRRPPGVGTKSNHPPLPICCSLTAPASGHPLHQPIFVTAAPLTVTLTVAVHANGPDGFDPPVPAPTRERRCQCRHSPAADDLLERCHSSSRSALRLRCPAVHRHPGRRHPRVALAANDSGSLNEPRPSPARTLNDLLNDLVKTASM